MGRAICCLRSSQLCWLGSGFKQAASEPAGKSVPGLRSVQWGDHSQLFLGAFWSDEGSQRELNPPNSTFFLFWDFSDFQINGYVLGWPHDGATWKPYSKSKKESFSDCIMLTTQITHLQRECDLIQFSYSTEHVHIENIVNVCCLYWGSLLPPTYIGLLVISDSR